MSNILAMAFTECHSGPDIQTLNSRANCRLGKVWTRNKFNLHLERQDSFVNLLFEIWAFKLKVSKKASFWKKLAGKHSSIASLTGLLHKMNLFENGLFEVYKLFSSSNGSNFGWWKLQLFPGSLGSLGSLLGFVESEVGYSNKTSTSFWRIINCDALHNRIVRPFKSFSRRLIAECLFLNRKANYNKHFCSYILLAEIE